MPDLNLDPDAPWTPERAREVAGLLAAAARLLNYATRLGPYSLTDPADLAAVAGDVQLAVSRLPQFAEQVRNLVAVTGRQWTADSPGMPTDVVLRDARAWADHASSEAALLGVALTGLHECLSRLRVKEVPDA
ncbi:MAG: hypothetical protein M0030_11505 [Actinomycetota bacterium]|nr:hypothetical protein [Actinomycetota bacterium]